MLIVLHGEDTFRSLRALEEIKEKFKREVDPSGASIIVIDGESGNALEILQNAIFAPSFFSRRRLIVLKNILKAPIDLQKRLEQALSKNQSGGEHIIACWEDGKIGEKAIKRKKSPLKKSSGKTVIKKDTVKQTLEKIFLNNPYIKYFPLLYVSELVLWILEECKRTGVKIEKPAAEELSRRIGSDLWKMSNELQKLSAMGKKEITLPAVRQYVFPVLEETVFNVTDEIIRGNVHGSLRSANRLLDNSVSFQEFFAILLGQFRNIWEVKAGLNRTNLHPFARKKAQENSLRFSENQIKNIVDLFTETDYEAKTAGHPPVLLLDRLIVKLSMIINDSSRPR